MQRSPFIEVLTKNAGKFHSVVLFDKTKEKLIRFDFTQNNKEITAEILDDLPGFINYVNTKLQNAGAKFGIGGYNELREVYSRSKLFDKSKNELSKSEVSEAMAFPVWEGREGGAEPRRLHLGIDIWGKPYTPVMAPLEGIIHSFGFNNNFGDYGATMILTHNIEGIVFHTLYGHLSLNSIKNLQEGKRVSKGDVIAEFGIPMENGQWPPHLHFQIIIDMETPIAIGMKGDYPGVCKFSEREKYLANCPDPDLILGMMKYAEG